ncbi:helix-turn-helix domain-containing protein [Diaphorobacter aerolatus]|uniref:helix-turn-helix domain-containing protein n=2 Tax=Comamonadaceae TaxID=80864 RepID=UPI0021F77C23|nr:helix-turn-helix transcriptional regulator [Diaphorobacter aerolatus]
MTQKEMARLLGVSPLSVYKWETGQVTPREAQLVRVREVLQMGVREARRQIAE